MIMSKEQSGISVRPWSPGGPVFKLGITPRMALGIRIGVAFLVGYFVLGALV